MPGPASGSGEGTGIIAEMISLLLRAGRRHEITYTGAGSKYQAKRIAFFWIS